MRKEDGVFIEVERARVSKKAACFVAGQYTNLICFRIQGPSPPLMVHLMFL